MFPPRRRCRLLGGGGVVGSYTHRLFVSCDSTKIEKEKREHAKQHGMIRTEITGAEIAEEMEKERRLFQLQMCEVGEISVK